MLEKAWENYISMFDCSEMDEEDIRELQRAFYAGASILFEELTGNVVRRKRKAAEKALARIGKEITVFAEKTLNETLNELGVEELGGMQ